MAIDFGSANATRYFTFTDTAAWTFPDGDWTAFALCRWDSGRLAGTAFHYYLSTGTFGAADAVNIYVSEDTEEVDPNDAWVNYEGNTGPNIITTGDQVTDDGVWRLVGARRNGSNLNSFSVSRGDTSVAISNTVDISSLGSADGSVVYVGGRADLNTDRFFGGVMQMVGKTDTLMSDAQLIAIINGAHPLAVNGSEYKALLDLPSVAGAVDLLTSDKPGGVTSGMVDVDSLPLSMGWPQNVSTAAGGVSARPQGPLGHPLIGAFGGPI